MRPTRRIALSLAALATTLACAGGGADGAGDTTATATSGDSAAPGATAAAPVECTAPAAETRDPTASGQQPAHPGQTRACAVTTDTSTYAVTVVASGLVHPWAVEPLPNGDLLVTERPGRMRIVTAAGQVGEPIQGVPRVDARGQGGLLDVALGPNYATDRTIYWSFSEPREGGNATSVARGVLSADGRTLEQVQVILRTVPVYDGTLHFGSRLAFGPDGMLYVTMGERSDAPMRQHAQRLDGHLGKILRITPDGQAPQDNPFVGQDSARAEIWTLGHRNVQAAAFDPQGRLWVVEHGTAGGDELNLIEKGQNYGWPRQAYGVEYSGQPIPNAQTAVEGMVQPVYYWDPVIAPSGAQFYTGDAFPAWRDNLFVGGLKETRLVRLVLQGGRVAGEEHLLTERRQRIRDVRQGPDGALYIVTDQENGELWRLAPRR